MKCQIPGCTEPVKSRGFCASHYWSNQWHNVPGVKERSRERMLKPKNRYRRAISRAREKKKVFDMSFEFYIGIISRGCFYCGDSLLEQTGISLDRIDNDEGYIVSNVLPCCGRCNQVRSNLFTVGETRAMITALLQYQAAHK